MNARLATVMLITLCGACSHVSQLRQVIPHADREGRSTAAVQIDSSPSSAWIYVNKRFIGSTPLEHEFHYDSNLREIEVVAQPKPEHAAQLRQRRSFPLPPLPTRIHFFMNNPVNLNNYE
jgi:hypothetical protein